VDPGGRTEHPAFTGPPRRLIPLDEIRRSCGPAFRDERGNSCEDSAACFRRNAMKIARLVLFVALAITVTLVAANAPAAAEIKVLCSNGFQAVLTELAPQFERATPHKVVVTYGLAAVLKQRIEAGEAFDVAILTPAAIDDLVKARKVAADSRTTLARSGLAIAIRAGARKPDITTVDAFKRALAGARSIAYVKEGASGVAFAALIQRLGLAEDLKTKTTLTASAEDVGRAVASGEAEFGVLPLSEVLPIRGAEALGTFPTELQSYIVMVAGVSAAASGQAARDLIAFLTAPAAAPVIKAKGMELQR
jgi:molybdate transport system substrate-binding protein